MFQTDFDHLKANCKIRKILFFVVVVDESDAYVDPNDRINFS